MRTEIKQMLNKVEKDIAELSNEIFSSKRIEEFEININTKHILEDIRSILDYIAVDIHNKYCTTHTNTKIYFQYSEEPNDEQDFIRRIVKNFPGLYENHKKIYTILSKTQWFYDDSRWLIKLHELTNEVKHNRLYIILVKKEKNTVISGDNTTMKITGDIEVKRENGRCGIYAPGSISISGTGRAAFYSDGTVAIDDGKYDMINDETYNLNKNVYYQNIIKSKKYDEDVIDLLRMMHSKLTKLIQNIEIYI